MNVSRPSSWHQHLFCVVSPIFTSRPCLKLPNNTRVGLKSSRNYGIAVDSTEAQRLDSWVLADVCINHQFVTSTVQSHGELSIHHVSYTNSVCILPYHKIHCFGVFFLAWPWYWQVYVPSEFEVWCIEPQDLFFFRTRHSFLKVWTFVDDGRLYLFFSKNRSMMKMLDDGYPINLLRKYYIFLFEKIKYGRKKKYEWKCWTTITL